VIQLFEGRHTLGVALSDYGKAWQDFAQEYKLQGWAKAMRPNTISWKVANKDALYENLTELAGRTEQAHIGLVNNRLIASIVTTAPVYQDIRIVKILERRPGSGDPLGLDSLDYLVKDIEKTYQLLKKTGANIDKENNEMHSWLSLRFGKLGEFEAKITDHLVLEVAIKELELSLKELSET
jgi:hypothetical protein